MHVARSTQQTMRGTYGLHLIAQAAVSIDEGAMACRVEQRTLLVLTVYLDHLVRDRAHCLHTYRLIIDERARAPIGELQAAQDKIAVDRDILRGGDAARRMVRGKIENRSYLALRRAGTYQRSVAAA